MKVYQPFSLYTEAGAAERHAKIKELAGTDLVILNAKISMVFEPDPEIGLRVDNLEGGIICDSFLLSVDGYIFKVEQHPEP